MPSLSTVYRDLIKHSAVYGIGQILTRLASILLLPIYTRELSPADYGVLAIFDLFTSLLGVLLATGVLRAVNRHHFEKGIVERERRTVWWTGLAILTLLTLAVAMPAMLASESLAGLLVGQVDGGPLYLRLVLATFCFTALEQLLQSHLRVQKQSLSLVSLSLGRLLLNIALNLYLLLELELGLLAIFTGNLVAGVVSTSVLGLLFVRERGRPVFDRRWLRPFFAYGGPLVLSSFLAVGLHQADRYLVRLLLDLSSAGLYSVGYMLGQGINTLVLTPFSQIWFVAIYEIDRLPERRRTYETVFQLYFVGMALIMLAVSLLAEPILALLVAPAFQDAAGIVPLVCLAYLLFSLHPHFVVPALLAKRTRLLIPGHFLALIANVLANLLLIPRLGIEGAALASVVSFAVFSFVGLALYRKVEKLDYPLLLVVGSLVGMSGSFAVWVRFAAWDAAPVRTAATAAAVWLFWAAVLAVRALRGVSLPDLRSLVGNRAT